MDTPIAVDPRVIAQALHMDDTSDLARLLTKWAQEALPRLEFDREWEPPSMESFEESVDRSRRLLRDAHEAMAAFNEDFPPDETE
jgi:hypothetical protein